jgi:hypothetical protein
MSVLYYRDSNGIFKPLPTIQGKSAYQGALEGGYHGAEEEFNQMLANLHTAHIPTPTSASVGQTIRVSAVDENGKPTEWEAVNFPEGGGGGGGGSSGGVWRRLRKFTTDGTEMHISISTDDNGDSFAVDELIFRSVVSATTSTTTGINTFDVYDNVNNKLAICVSTFFRPNTENTMRVSILSDNLVEAERINNRLYPDPGQKFFVDNACAKLVIARSIGKITKLSMNFQGANPLDAGIEIEVYGK